MKHALILLAMGLTTAGALAQDHVELPLVVGHLATRDGKVYEGATIVGEDEVGVKVQHDGGTARVLYSKLPEELARKFAASAAEGKALLEENARKQKEAADARREQEKEIPEKGGYIPGPPRVTVVEAPLKLDEETEARIAALQAYISKLKKGVIEATAAMDKDHRRAAELRASANMTFYDSDGHSVTTQNPSKMSKATYYDNQAGREGTKIAEAQRLIAETEQKIATIRATPPPAPPAKKAAN